MGININVTEQQILQGDTMSVRKELENLIQASTLIKKFENDVSIIFFNTTPLDMIKKLKTEDFRVWFRKLDKEVPGAPYFFNHQSNTLLYFLMGNIAFEEKDNSIHFNELDAQRFFKEKVAQIKNICLPNNINPQSGIIRLSSLLSGEKENKSSSENAVKAVESEKKGVAIKDYLDKYGSIAFMNKDRAVKLTLVLKEIPQRISFSKNFLVKDSSHPQPFFLTVMKTDSEINEIRSIIFPSISDVEDSLKRLGGVYIQVVTKAEDLSYQSLFESDTIFPVETVLSIKDEIQEKESPQIIEQSEIIEEKQAEAVKEKSGTNSDQDELSRLKSENEELRNKLVKLEKLMEIYEDEVHRKQSVTGFFRKFFH